MALLPSSNANRSWLVVNNGPDPGPQRKESNLFDLREVELDRGRPAENRHRDADLRLVVVDVLDRTIEVGERPFLDAHGFAHFPLHLRTRLLDTFLHLGDD